MRVFLKKDKLYENKTCVINGLATLSFPARWFRLPEGNLGTREAMVTDFYFHDVKYAMFTSIPKGWEIEVPRSESLWDMSSARIKPLQEGRKRKELLFRDRDHVGDGYSTSEKS